MSETQRRTEVDKYFNAAAKGLAGATLGAPIVTKEPELWALLAESEEARIRLLEGITRIQVSLDKLAVDTMNYCGPGPEEAQSRAPTDCYAGRAAHSLDGIKVGVDALLGLAERLERII